jgi:hypothetical protein
MFVRAKEAKGRRYLYLVEGRRVGGAVRQKTLCYLGPLSNLTAGVPDAAKKRVDARIRVDWNKTEEEIGRIPLTFDELAEARRDQFAISVRTRGERRRPSQGNLPRAEGELSALAKLAARRFEETFEEAGPLVYRMK